MGFQETLRPYGIVVDYGRVAGMRTRQAMDMLLPEHGVTGADALRRMQAERPVEPGDVDVVERLSSRFPVALASSGSRDSGAAFLDMNHARLVRTSGFDG